MLKKSIDRQGNSRRPRSCALEKAEASYVKKIYRGNYKRLRSCALKKDPRQAMLKKSIGKPKCPRSCALEKAEVSYVKKIYRQGNSKRLRNCALKTHFILQRVSQAPTKLCVKKKANTHKSSQFIFEMEWIVHET